MMTTQSLNLNKIHASWLPFIEQALKKMDSHYLSQLAQNNTWLPGHDHIFNAFSIPLDKVHTILFGESPYPRQDSANGYAFWDARVKQIWSETGLSKTVNRATSLRNFIKMLLVTEGLLLENDTSQTAIANINKTRLIKNLSDLFTKMQQQGILLLNASLVLHPDIKNSVNKDAKAWQPFMVSLLEILKQHRPEIILLLFGNIAKTLGGLSSTQGFQRLVAEHPYNLSFIHNKSVQDFFKPMRLIYA